MSDFKNKLISYYRSELEQIEPNRPIASLESAKIQVKKGDKNTKWLSLNDESATELVHWLKENFNIS